MKPAAVVKFEYVQGKNEEYQQREQRVCSFSYRRCKPLSDADDRIAGIDQRAA
jgi:hypothetical protein